MLPRGAASASGPRYLDEDYAEKVSEKTLERYKAYAREFSSWLTENSLQPNGVAEWDDLLVEWKNDPGKRLTKAAMASVFGALEVVLPRAQGQPRSAHAFVAGWSAMGRITQIKTSRVWFRAIPD